MDHDHGDSGSDSSTTTTCPMIMVFHGGHCERILWKTWVASTVTEFVFSALAFFAMAFLYEFLKFLREYLQKRSIRMESQRIAEELRRKSNQQCPSADGTGCLDAPLAEPDIREVTYVQRIFGAPHLVQTLLYFVQVVISYLLMLVFMNFNYWLCLAVVLGLALGYFFFGWIKQAPADIECCN